VQPLLSFEYTLKSEAQFASCNAYIQNCCCCLSYAFVWKDIRPELHPNRRVIFYNAVQHLTVVKVSTSTCSAFGANNRDGSLIFLFTVVDKSSAELRDNLQCYSYTRRMTANPAYNLQCTYTAHLSISGIPSRQFPFPTPSGTGSHPL
jgi:hypothetical protein